MGFCMFITCLQVLMGVSLAIQSGMFNLDYIFQVIVPRYLVCSMATYVSSNQWISGGKSTTIQSIVFVFQNNLTPTTIPSSLQ